LSDSSNRPRKVAAAGVAAALLVAPACDGGPQGPHVGGGIATARQASWDIRAYPAGLLGKLHKREKEQLKDQRKKLSTILKDTYDALFLRPRSTGRVVRRWFSPRSAHALLKSRIGPPGGTAKLRTTRRVATIGIQAPSARRAAARVRVQARLLKGDRYLRLRHRSTLWLERVEGKWTVIAFDVEQKEIK
jgi:hypothetical protein